VDQHVDHDVETPGTGWVPAPDEPLTAELPAADRTPTEPAGLPSLALDEDPEEWMVAPVARGVRLRVPSLILLALGVAAGAFWGGAVAQRHQGGTTTATAAGLAARARAAGFGRTGTGTGGTGAGLAGGVAGAPATRGLVTNVQGSLVEITDSTGALVKVQIGPSTTVTRTGTGAPGALQIGDTATVRGAAGTDGTIAATSITATAQGLPAAGGFGGGAGGFTGGAAG
jgi:hypothetical protein